MKFIINLFNTGAHVGAGAWTGTGINNPKYRWGVLVLAAGFLGYQALGAWKKNDLGGPEVKEYLIGLAIPMVYQRAKDWMDNRRLSDSSPDKPGHD